MSFGAAVITIVPFAPTPQQPPDGQETSWSWFVVPEVCAAHDEPPLAVAMIVPLAPTDQQELADWHETP